MTTPMNLGRVAEPTGSAELLLPGGWSVIRAGAVLRVLGPDGRCLTEVTGAAPGPLSVACAWRGIDHDGPAPHWWALAFGRADVHEPLSVTFTGRRLGGRSTIPVRTVVRPLVADGLWVAAARGLQFAVTCRQGVHERVQRITPLPGRWPLSRQSPGRAAG